MSIIVRRIAATPKRTAVEVWQTICEMVTNQTSAARKTLESITGVAAAIISDEIPYKTSFVLVGKGPRVRIYCMYGEDALINDNCNEDSLVQNPTSGDWHMYVPCDIENLSWVKEALSTVSAFITAYDKEKDLNIEKGADKLEKLTVDTRSFLNKL